MNKAIGAALASVVLVTSSIGTVASAEPRHHRQFDRHDRVIQNQCRNNWDNDCRDWNSNRGRWDETRYNRWYRDHHRDRGFRGDNAAAAIFGFAAGAAASVITGSINGGTYGSHVARCEARFRSYDRPSNTYLGYDGDRHECRL